MTRSSFCIPLLLLTLLLPAVLTVLTANLSADGPPPKPLDLGPLASSQEPKLPYDPSHYPRLAGGIQFFGPRLLSPNFWVRYELLGDVGAQMPLPEAESLLRALLMDPDPRIGEQALLTLSGNGFTVSRKALPPGFAGFDQTDPKALAEHLATWRGEQPDNPPRIRKDDSGPPIAIDSPGAAAGRAAQLLGLLGDQTDIPRLKPLLAHENVYVRTCATFALLNLGDVTSAKPALLEIAHSPVTQENCLYIRIALLTLHRLGEPTALPKLVSYLQAVENDSESSHHYVVTLKALANLTGIWLNSASAWQKWLEDSNQDKAPAADPPRRPPAL